MMVPVREPVCHGRGRLVLLISFDVDGTLEVGDPPGIITMDMVRKAQAQGYVIGSCSDRPLSNQREMWQAAEIVVAFTVLKHNLDDVKAEFEADQYFHFGDTFMDKYFAAQSGFEFIDVTDTTTDLWLPFAPFHDGNPWWEVDPPFPTP
jgi:hypothetical protein